MPEPTGAYPQFHHAEAFRQGYESQGTLRWGWQCLTCGDEKYVPTMLAAEQGAERHKTAEAKGDQAVRDA